MQGNITELDEFDWHYWSTVLEVHYLSMLDRGRLAGHGRCLLWTGKVDDQGYPLNKDGKQTHRAVVKLLGITVRRPLVVRHLCGDRRCLRPSHLGKGTQKENAMDRAKHGKTAKGEKHGNSKLSDIQRAEIRDRHDSGESIRDIAESYPVGPTQVYRICRGVKG